ncbi:unnamed protein product [Psylliodes chrysocephalus]|uniref:Mutator-like transposase domain-containing protein n=1 Tax=Psylliodes chrysocephalus TaxID=3402493 RepID=A0A9P0D3N3_9CUCU|nr:unnamed protein product [Psylliodes chrysocephala]
MPLFNCAISQCDIINETRDGYFSSFTIKCKMCGITSCLNTDDPTTKLDVNMTAVIGSTCIGNGQWQLEEFTSVLNMPALNSVQYNTVHNKMEKIVDNVFLEELRKAGEEEAAIAQEKGDVDSTGTPYITVIADGAWSKRSYKTNYNALSGVAVIIGEATKKVLFMGVKNKFCTICLKFETKIEDAPQHQCAKNWKGSSTSMESAIILDGFQCSVEMHGLKYTTLVGDGDNSITKKLSSHKPYGATPIQKIECVNHLLRNFCNKLKDFSKSRTSPSSHLIIPLNLRKKLESNILRFRIAIKKAAAFHIQMTVPLAEKYDCFRMTLKILWLIYSVSMPIARNIFAKEQKTRKKI